jgi:processive 1,2-diacylglycerol beta-glucosyltransferase
MPEFAQRIPRPEARRKLGIAADRTTILVLSGGYGVGNVVDIVRSVEKGCSSVADRSFTLVVICGRNASLNLKLSGLEPLPNVSRHVFGFVDNMHDFMFASDLVVTKSGGLTSSEALAVGLPMIVVDPIPGQERHNADMLVEGGVALIALNEAQLEYKLRLALGTPDWMRKARDAAAAMGKATAGREILRKVLEVEEADAPLRKSNDERNTKVRTRRG